GAGARLIRGAEDGGDVVAPTQEGFQHGLAEGLLADDRDAHGGFLMSWERGGSGAAPQWPVLIQTTLGSVKLSMAASPCSRPKPESRAPPQGRRTAVVP